MEYAIGIVIGVILALLCVSFGIGTNKKEGN